MKIHLEAEIAWWSKKACEKKSEASLIAFGIATGLKMAQSYYNAKSVTFRDQATQLKQLTPNKKASYK